MKASWNHVKFSKKPISLCTLTLWQRLIFNMYRYIVLCMCVSVFFLLSLLDSCHLWKTDEKHYGTEQNGHCPSPRLLNCGLLCKWNMQQPFPWGEHFLTLVLTALKQYLFLGIECFQGVVHFSTQSGLKVITLPRWVNQTEFNEVKWGKRPANLSKPTTLCCATSCQCRMLSARKDSPFQQCKIRKLSKDSAD